MALTALTQTQRPELAYVKPIHLVDVDLGTLVMRWAMRDYVFKYASTRLRYESYLLGISGLGEQSAFNQTSNPKITLLIADERYRSFAHLSLLHDEIDFQRATVTIYESLLIDDDEIFAFESAGRTIKWKGVVERVYDIDTRNGTFKIDCCSRSFSLRNRIGLSRVSTAQFPNADKACIGQWRNLVVGDIDYVPCKLIKTGATDLLFSALTDGTISSIIVSGTSRIPWSSSGTIQIDSEKFTYSSYNTSTKTFSGVSRASGGTTAAAHNKGATVYQVTSEFIYEASCIPVDTITDVYVDGVRQSIGSSIQAYTGRSGQQLSGYGETAVVRFTTRPVIEKQYNTDVEVTQEHSHTTDEGSHGHTFSGATTVVRTGISTSSSGHVETPDYVRDSDEGTSCRIISDPTYTQDAWLYLGMNNGSNLGTITGIIVKVLFSASVSNSGSSLDKFTIRYGGYTVMSWAGNTGGCSLGKGWRSYAVSTGAGWSGDLDFHCEQGSSNGYASAYIYEAHVEITCAPRIANAAASGVETERSGSTAVSGSSVAEAIIGKEVTVAIRGVRDDPVCTGGLPAGTITGTAGTVIRRLDHVIKFFLCGRMGVPVADIGDSFATAGTWYAANDVYVDFLAQDLATDAQRLLQELASQGRSILYEWGGKFELAIVPNFDPGTVDFTIEATDIVSGPVFSFQALADTANRIMIMYGKDYRTYKETGAQVQGPIKAEAQDAGFMDYLEDGWGARDLDETVRLTAIRSSAAAQKYLDWYKVRKKLPEMTVSLQCHWRETLVTPGMTFGLTDAVRGYGAYLVTNYRQNIDSQQIDILGQLLPEWTADECFALAYADTPAIVQTHIIEAQECVALAYADTPESLCFIEAQECAALAYADTPAIVQTHLVEAQECAALAYADNAPLGVGWQMDAVDDLQPAEYTGVTGWWEDDAPDLMPRNTVSGTDNFWEEDGSGDLMPESA